MAQVLNINDGESAPFIEHANALACESDQSRVIKAIRHLSRRCDEWKTILDFRKFSLAGAFRELRNTIFQANFKPQINLASEITDESMKVMDGLVVGNEGFLQKAALLSIRTTRVSSFKNLKKKVEAFGDSLAGPLSEAISAMKDFGYDTPSSEVSVLFVEADDNTSFSNEDWHNNMSTSLDKLSAYLSDKDRIISICDKAL
jgi:hypothetical protein